MCHAYAIVIDLAFPICSYGLCFCCCSLCHEIWECLFLCGLSCTCLSGKIRFLLSALSLKLYPSLSLGGIGNFGGCNWQRNLFLSASARIYLEGVSSSATCHCLTGFPELYGWTLKCSLFQASWRCPTQQKQGKLNVLNLSFVECHWQKEACCVTDLPIVICVCHEESISTLERSTKALISSIFAHLRPIFEGLVSDWYWAGC